MFLYYATYKGIGESEIVEFLTEQERDDWVEFKDELSRSLNITKQNCTFDRKSLSPNHARRLIKKALHTENDDYNDRVKWYFLNN